MRESTKEQLIIILLASGLAICAALVFSTYYMSYEEKTESEKVEFTCKFSSEEKESINFICEKIE